MEPITRVVKVDADSPDPSAIREAARILRSGGLVAFPTETVYGLGADATNPSAVARIFEAKGRPSNNPLIVHAPDLEAIRACVSTWPENAAKLAEHFWPGPLTLVLPRSKLIPDLVTGGGETVGVRIPDSHVALSLLRAANVPLAAPSANRSTGVSPTRAEHVWTDLNGRIAMILDGGCTHHGIESTVLDLDVNPPRILRPGAISAEQITIILRSHIESPSIVATEAESALSSPGQMALHYSPKTPVVVVSSEDMIAGGEESGLIVAGYELPGAGSSFRAYIAWIDPVPAAHELYETLHRWDELHLREIRVVLPPDTDAWRAVRDRLWRASRKWSKM